MRSTEAERAVEVTKDSAGALRLLYACLSPLEGRQPGEAGSYHDFLRDFPQKLKHKLRCPDVLNFLREALKVPDSKDLMLLLLIDEGNAALETFPRQAYGKPPKVRTLASSILLWKCMSHMHSFGCKHPTLCQAVTSGQVCWLLRVHDMVEEHLPCAEPLASPGLFSTE